MTNVFVLCVSWPSNETFDVLDIYSTVDKAKKGALAEKNIWRGEPRWREYGGGLYGDLTGDDWFYVIHERAVDPHD